MSKSNTKMTKSAIFTDIHFGRRSNSVTHNQDCLDFVNWMCDAIESDGTIDNILFLGDWYQHRDSINVSTQSFSYAAIKRLNSVGIPIYFCVGNHDLHKRNTREVFSTEVFEHLDNVHIIVEPTVVADLGEGGTLLCPYLFHDEYEDLSQFANIPVWAGHFEFKGFVITGQKIKMMSGPDHERFRKQKKIFSGHFHKRQQSGNVRFVGNAFPMDFSDVNDTERGFCVYDHALDQETYHDWLDCPKFFRTTLSTVLDDPDAVLYANSRIECVMDETITYEESHALRQALITQYSLREFTYIDNGESDRVLVGDEEDVDVEHDDDLSDAKNIDELVLSLLGEIDAETISADTLVQIYEGVIQ